MEALRKRIDEFDLVVQDFQSRFVKSWNSAGILEKDNAHLYKQYREFRREIESMKNQVKHNCDVIQSQESRIYELEKLMEWYRNGG